MKKKIGITLAVIALLVCIISVVAFTACKETSTQEASEAAWAEISNKSAKTTVKIEGVEVAIGVDGNDKAISVVADAQIDLVRTWKDGVLTIDITAKPTKVELKLNAFIDGLVGGLIKNYVNFDKLSGLEFKGQAFYEYGDPDKTIGIRDMSVTGLDSAIPALTDENITDEPWEIAFMIGGQRVTEVSYPVAELNGLIMEGEVGAVVSQLFNEDYTLDLGAIIDDLLLNQTLLDFSNEDNANNADGTYTNSVSALDNLNFLMNVWNNISADGMNALNAIISPDMEIEVTEGVFLPVGQILGVFLDDSEFTNLLPNLLENLITKKGTMSVNGTIENDIFTSLNMTIQNAEIDLSQDQVNSIAKIVLDMLEGVDFGSIDVTKLVDEIAGGDAYIDFGKITVNSTFTVA